MIQDELASKTIHNAVMLLRNTLVGRKGPSAFRRGLAFADSTLGVKLPPSSTARLFLLDTGADTGTDQGCEKTWRAQQYIPSRTEAFCGMRRSEVLGLRFPDIRWFDNEIRIQHAIRSGAPKMVFTSGSGPSGRQNLASRCAAFRRPTARRGSLPTSRSATPIPRNSSSLETVTECIDPDRFEPTSGGRIVKQAELPGTRFHDLRHFFASQSIANGETAAYVRDQMDHSSIHVTFEHTTARVFWPREKSQR